MADAIRSRWRVVVALLLLLPLLLIGCRDFKDRTGSSGLAQGAKVDVSGEWEGDWNTIEGSGDAGTVRFVLNQDDDNNVVGRSFWTGSACWDDGGDIGGVETVGEGEIFEGAIDGSLLGNPAIAEILQDPFGTSPRVGRTIVRGRLDTIGDLMTGTFDVVRADERRCSDGVSREGDRGTLTLRRVE